LTLYGIKRAEYHIVCDFPGCGRTLDNVPNCSHDIKNLLKREGWVDGAICHYCPDHVECPVCAGLKYTQCKECGESRVCPVCKGLGRVNKEVDTKEAEY